MKENCRGLEVKGSIPSSKGEKSSRLKEEAMIREGTFEAIQDLKRQGFKKRKVAEILGLSRHTVRKYWKRAKWEGKAGMKRPSLLDPFREHLATRAPDTDYCAQVMFLELRKMGYTGGYEQVKRFVRPFREERRRFEEATIRFETGPAKQAQVDWGSTRVELARERVKIHLFVKVLGYSRRIYARAEEDEKLATFLACHERAFRWFEGLTLDILYDNPKTVCLTRDFEGKDIGWNPGFLDFTRYWGFSPKLCKPYRARTKGKVESGVKYVKKSFFALYGRRFSSFEELNEKLERWCLEVADERIHGTTHEQPRVRFESEQLLPLEGKTPYRMEVPLTRIIPQDALVCYKTNRYSVPWALVGKEAALREVGERIKIYVEGSLAADHPLLGGRYQQNVIPGHYEGIFRLRTKREPGPVSLVSLWAQAAEEVEVRDLGSYEALVTGLPAEGLVAGGVQ